MIIPQHLAIIMDGNRRWAKQKNLPSFRGHKHGLGVFKDISKYCQKKGIKILTVFAFSTENWNRSKTEINFLIKLFLSLFSKKDIQELQDREVKLNIIGQKKRFSALLQKKMKKAEEQTKNNKNFILNIALSYGGRADIVEATKKILKKGLSSEEIDESLFSQYLWTKGLQDPDLIIRTGGEKRISNFLIWQGAYSELYFSDTLWPDFNKEELDKIFEDYATRKRNFGR